MNDAELIEKVKTAYRAIGRIPSRGVNLDSKFYAGAIHAMTHYERLESEKDQFVSKQTEDWRRGFGCGFEWVDGEPRWIEFRRGVEQGIAVAKAIFEWMEAPNVYHPLILRESDRDNIINFLQNEVASLRKMLESK